MWENHYKAVYDKVQPDTALVQAVMEELTQDEMSRKKATRKKKTGMKSWAKAAVAAGLFCCLSLSSVSVLAANSSNILRLVERFSPELAQWFLPVGKASEDQGIRMAVEAIYVDGKKAEVYVSMQDMEGDRVDETADLFDSYYFVGTGSATAGCSRVDYDTEENKAVFKIQIEQMEKEFDKEKFTFGVRELLGKKMNEVHEIPLENVVQEAETLDLVNPAEYNNRINEIKANGGDAEAENNQRRKMVQQTGGSGERVSEADKRILDVEGSWECPMENFNITGMGYVNGKLHIQFEVGNILEYDRHLWPVMYDKEGSAVKPIGSMGFLREIEGERCDYDEFIFDVPYEELDNYRLEAEFWDSQFHMEGDWKVTFRLNNIPKE